MVVLDEELLGKLALWWVVFVFWATRPNYG